VGLATVMDAPNAVRGGSHSGNVAAIDLARAGLLDAVQRLRAGQPAAVRVEPDA
jgi:alpha-D-ribose 1-methylphosphonate 5-triphosphate diphosphatase PhnM